MNKNTQKPKPFPSWNPIAIAPRPKRGIQEILLKPQFSKTPCIAFWFEIDKKWHCGSFHGSWILTEGQNFLKHAKWMYLPDDEDAE